jgi:hypothetical protein
LVPVKNASVPLKILIVVGALAAVVGVIWLLGFVLDKYLDAWEFIVGVWGGFGRKVPAEFRIWVYAGGLGLMLLSGFFFPTVMDWLNLLPLPWLVTPVKIIYALVSFIILIGSGFMALGSLPDDFGIWGLAQLVGLFIAFGLAVKLWCRK